MPDRKTSTHILIKEPEPGLPGEFRHRIECMAPDSCEGWWECDKPHEVDGVNADEGPDDCEEGAPWEGRQKFDFHGITHTWRDGWGWTIPFEGCVTAAADWEVPEEVESLPLGRYQVDEEWIDTSVYLVYRGPEVTP